MIAWDGSPNCSRQAFAVPALLGAAHPDPLRAALDAVHAAAASFGVDHRAFLTEAAQVLH